MEQSATDSRTPEDTPVNYLPGTPAASETTGRIERFVRRLLRRRGPLRPVVRGED